MMNSFKPCDEKVKRWFDQNRYELISKIGEGGFSQVFHAIDHANAQTVAIKISALVRCSNVRKGQLIHFKKECDFLLELSHSNIIKILDYGCIRNKLLYQVFRKIEGLTLNEYLKQNGPLDARLATEIMTQILKALIHLHQHQIVHQDIKPSNLIISQTQSQPHVTLIDFGISTRPNLMPEEIESSLGTPYYCPPEQLQGKPPTFGNDLYMWGLVYLECLTGIAPSVTIGKSAETQEIATILPDALTAHPLGELFRQILKKDPQKRLNNAQYLMAQLQEISIDDLEKPFAILSSSIDQQPTQIIHHAYNDNL